MNGNGARHRKKSLPTPSRNALFRSRAHFWSILGSNLGPRTASLGRLSADFRDFFVIFGPPAGSQVVFLCSRVLGEGAGPDSGCPGEPPGRNLKRFSIIFCVVLRHDSGPSFVQSLDQTVIRHRCLTPTCLVRSSYLWCWQAPRGGVMKMMHFLRSTAYCLAHTACHTVSSQYVGIRLHHQDWIGCSP